MSYYLTIPHHIYSDEALSMSAKILFGYMSSVASKTGVNFSTNEQIEEDIRLTPYHTRKALSELEQAGLIKISIVRGNFRRVYILDLIEAIAKRKEHNERQKTNNNYKKINKPDWLNEYIAELEAMEK